MPYAIAALLLGAQMMSIGFLAELMTAFLGRDADTYSIAERIPPTNLPPTPTRMNRPIDNSSAGESHAGVRRAAYLVLIAVSIGGMLGRVAAVNSVDRIAQRKLKKQGCRDWQIERPFLSGNDRSRWATVRRWSSMAPTSLHDVVTQPGWDTIDMVKHDDQGARVKGRGRAPVYRASRRCWRRFGPANIGSFTS